MPIFDYRFTVAAPLEAVSAFHFQTGILKAFTPPLMIMQVHRFDPLANGSIGEFTMWMGPIPVRLGRRTFGSQPDRIYRYPDSRSHEVVEAYASLQSRDP